MNQLIDWYFQALKFLVVFMIGTMVVLVLGNVILRYGFNSGIAVSEELSRWAFVWLTYTAAIVAMRENTHLGMDSVVSKLPLSGRRFCYAVSHLLMLLCVVLFGIGSWHQVVINLRSEASASGLSVGLFFYSSGIFFSVPAALILLNNMYLLFTGKLTENQLISVKESEEELGEEALAELRHEMELETKRLAAGNKP